MKTFICSLGLVLTLSSFPVGAVAVYRPPCETEKRIEAESFENIRKCFETHSSEENLENACRTPYRQSFEAFKKSASCEKNSVLLHASQP